MQKLKAIILIVSILALLLCLGLSAEQMNILFEHSTYFIICILFILRILRLVGVYGKKCKKD